LPWQNLLHAGEENLFSGLTALSAEFTIGEGELMAHDVPLGCAPDEYDDLISGTCSHLPYPAIACFPLLLMLAGCAPMHETRQALSQQTPAAQVDTALSTALKNGWPDSQWWLEYHDNQLTSLINNALQNAPDMQVAEQRIQLAEA
jgi:hypothetical protein